MAVREFEWRRGVGAWVTFRVAWLKGRRRIPLKASPKLLVLSSNESWQRNVEKTLSLWSWSWMPGSLDCMSTHQMSLCQSFLAEDNPAEDRDRVFRAKSSLFFFTASSGSSWREIGRAENALDGALFFFYSLCCCDGRLNIIVGLDSFIFYFF